MEQLQEKIFIGTLKDGGASEEIRENDITAVHKLTHKVPPSPYPAEVNILPTVLIDRNISRYDNFEKAVKALVHSLRNGERVLIHCSAGVSRTPIVTATAIAHVEGRPLTDVIDDVETTMLTDGFDVARRGDDERPTDIHPRLREFAEELLESKDSFEFSDDYEPVQR